MKLHWKLILIVAGLLLAVFMLINFNRRMEELNRLSRDREAVYAEGTTIMHTQEALVTRVAYATSDAAVEQWAYENKWVRKGEHLIQPVPEGDVPVAPAVPPVTQSETPPNWRIWWELFFGVN
jgi:hypothetical protein